MTRDYKPASTKAAGKGKRRSSKRRRKSVTRKQHSSARWQWLLVGLLMGLSGSAVMWWLLKDQSGQTAPLQRKQASVRSPQSAPKNQETKTRKNNEATHFDFYRLLPKMEVLIPDEEITQARAALPKEKDRGPFIVQAGSFRRLSEADSLKARLALLGIVADIQRIVVNNGSTWHRVRIGPFKTVHALKKIRRQLRKARIEFVVIELAG